MMSAAADPSSNGGAPSRGIMSNLTNFMSNPSSRVKKLLNWRQSNNVDDDTWMQNAVEVLIKRIQKYKGKEQGRIEMEYLEQVLSNPLAPSRCLTIPRTIDGRIQVGHRKGHPHVLYCRIWRWPDLTQSSELRAIPTCEHPFDSKDPDVCINPTHYERISTNGLPPIMVPLKFQMTADAAMVDLQQLQIQEFEMVQQQYNNNIHNLVPNATIDFSPPGSCGADSGMFSNPSSPEEGEGYSITPPPLNNQAMNGSLVAGGFDQQQQSASAIVAATTVAQPSNCTSIVYEEAQHWATIAYFELNCRVGDTFQCYNYEVTVDGFTNPHSNTNRFCLGQLSNVNRNSTIEQTRRHIGKGVQLTFVNGCVYARNLSESAIFVQSRNLNNERNFHLNTVCKIPPGETLVIFNNLSFSNLLAEAVVHGFEVVYDLTKMCTMRISFVKGWGAEYHRQDVTSTPCWIEVHMNGALKWLDSVLTTMGSPSRAISSVS